MENAAGRRKEKDMKKIRIYPYTEKMISPRSAFMEARRNFARSYPSSAFECVERVFEDFNDLFEGKYHGYRRCNTIYHDKTHTTDTLLAMSRLIDGYNGSERKELPFEEVRIAFIAALFHDAGFIQKSTDRRGTGGKYTLTHVARSITFMKKYFSERRFARRDFVSARNIVQCTGVRASVRSIKFSGKTEKILGFMLGTADLLSQMAAPDYLAKLPHLYREFREGRVPGYRSEEDLLKKTPAFYEETKTKLKTDFRGVSKYSRAYFAKRHGMAMDVYTECIERHMEHIKEALRK